MEVFFQEFPGVFIVFFNTHVSWQITVNELNRLSENPLSGTILQVLFLEFRYENNQIANLIYLILPNS
jgi:hypothetical protein